MGKNRYDSHTDDMFSFAYVLIIYDLLLDSSWRDYFMVIYFVAFALYIFAIFALVVVGKKARKSFSMISLPYFMRCIAK